MRHGTAGRSGRGPRPDVVRAWVAAGGFLAVVIALVLTGRVERWVLGIYAFTSAMAFLRYRADKAAARRRGWRTPEASLHAIALVGGWPGALVARHVLRHKTTKQPFRSVFWLTVVLNCAALAWLVAAG
ncbi:DUF1294 domain-containing protein [Rothia sp. ARF10]|nr:DUF1294 domain-containing protein [Rothia sp. ARF10]